MADDRRKGFLLLHRRSMDAGDPLWVERPFGRWRARLDLIASASYRQHDRQIGERIVSLAYGQVLASHGFLARRWGWPRPRVQRFLERLIREKTLELVRHEGQAGRVFLVVNFEAYQGPKEGLKRGRTRYTPSIPQSSHPTEPPPALETNDLGADPIHPSDTPSDSASVPKRKKGSIEGRDRESEPPVLIPIPDTLKGVEFEDAWNLRVRQWPDLGHMEHIMALGTLQKLAQQRGVAYAIVALQRAVTGRHRTIVFPEDYSREARPFSDGDGEATWRLRDELRKLEEIAEAQLGLKGEDARRRRQLKEELRRRDLAREE